MDDQFIEQCLFCRRNMKMTNLITSALQCKYEHKSQISIDDFLDDNKKTDVIWFYEKLYNQEEEFLEKKFQNTELHIKHKELLQYYKYQINNPRLYMRKVQKTINEYQNKKKNIYYLSIQKQLGQGKKPPTQRIRTEPDKYQAVLFDITKDEPSKSVIALLNLLNNESRRKVQFQSQVSQIQSQIPTVEISARNRIIQKQLKAILTSDVIPKYQTTTLSRKSLLQFKSSTLKISTFHSTKSPAILSNRSTQKMKSSPLISIPKCKSFNQISFSPKIKNLRVLLQHKK